MLPLLSVFGILLAACKSGPQITPWIGEPDGLVYGKQKIKWEDAKGYQCLNPDDVRKFYRSCRMGSAMPLLNYCVVFENAVIACSDGETRGPSQMLNWTCLDEGDSEEFLIFCKRRAGNMEPN